MIQPSDLPSAFRGIRTFRATAVTVLEGQGTADDPCYLATYIYDDRGTLLGDVTYEHEGGAGRVARTRLYVEDEA